MPTRFRIAVTGASGFVGKHVVRALSSRGHRVIAIARQTVRESLPEVRQVVVGDLKGTIDWISFLDGADVVIHLAGIAHAGGRVAESIYNQVNHLATAALAHAVNRLQARLIFVSSVAAQVGPSCDRVVTEHDRATPTSAYGRSKRAAEIAIAAANGRYVILRPTLVYGGDAKANMAKVIQLAKLPLPLPFASIDNRRSLLGIKNFNHAIEFLITHEEIDKETFLIADPEPLSLAEIVSYLREGIGRPPNLISIPPQLLAAVFSFVKRSEMWERLSGNLVVSTEHLRQAGYSAVESTREGLIALGRNSTSHK
jgi:nucleoside-diphosphate-sugar epimerase